MNRRKAIKGVFVIGAGAGILYFGRNLYRYFVKPEIGNLDSHLELISDLAETIIPETTSPGAKQAGVGRFIIRMVKDCTNASSQHNFLEGLNDIQNHSDEIYHKPFSSCDQTERTNILKNFQPDETGKKTLLAKVKKRAFGDPFYTTLKKYTVIGYCNSKAGASEGLAYDHIPGKFTNTMIFPGQRSWATK